MRWTRYYELPGHSKLAKVIRKYYPDLQPVWRDDGELLDVIPLKFVYSDSQDTDKVEPKNSKTRYTKRSKRAKNAVPFIRELM